MTEHALNRIISNTRVICMKLFQLEIQHGFELSSKLNQIYISIDYPRPSFRSLFQVPIAFLPKFGKTDFFSLQSAKIVPYMTGFKTG